jgi:diguanylate cyclase (GGDEF)-like protein/PAS domain S-box-containing protein
MTSSDGTGSELDPLWEKLANLKRLDSELGAAEESCLDLNADQIKAEIEARLGFLPPFFSPALGAPLLLDGLWRQQLFCYYDSPLPGLFKEKLSVNLARYCSSPYFLVTHACALYQLGMPAQEIRQLLEKPNFTADDIRRILEILAGFPRPFASWPVDDRIFEECVIACGTALFLGAKESLRCASELKEILGPSSYASLVALLSGIKSAHLWIEAHPEVTYEKHEVVRSNYPQMLRSEPHLSEIIRCHRSAAIQKVHGRELNGSVLGDEDIYRELFENASDIILAVDFDGRLISANRAVERISGYTMAEAFQMKLQDVIPPEYAQLCQRLLDPKIGGEIPLNYEIEIIAKDQSRIALSVNSRPIFRAGKAIGIQGIARDITQHKKTETALQEANLKLEAWVSELEERTREMTMLNEMGDILRACFTLDEAYNVIVRVAQQIFPVQVGALYVIAPSRHSVESVAVWGDAALAERVFSPQECWALRRGRMHWVQSAHSGLICKHVHQPPADGYLCIPMMAQSEAIGVLHLMQPDNVKMTESKQRMAVTMSEHIAMALSNLKLHETLRSQSIRDPLTGLFNRRFMEESLELEIRRATRNQRSLGMIMIDLDHFKYFNDNFGHEAGDLLLKELGALLRGNIRGEDVACRYGGEEFMLILPEGTSSVTRQRAEFYKEAIQRLDVHYRGRPLGRITASMGVAIFPDHGRTAKALIEAADKALYQSKNAGRDRVTLAG